MITSLTMTLTLISTNINTLLYIFIIFTVFTFLDIAEGFAFSYVGLSMWEFVDDGFHIQFSVFILFVVIASRLITILVLCCICKLFSKNFNMPLAEQLAFTLGKRDIDVRE